MLSPLAVAVAFHAIRGMYLHAERLLAKAGRQGAGRGGSPTLEAEAKLKRKERSEAKGRTSAARKPGETPCAAPGRSPQRGLASLFARVRAQVDRSELGRTCSAGVLGILLSQ